MTGYANFFDTQSATKIEIEEGAVATSRAFAPDLLSAIKRLALLVTDGISSLPEAKRPADLEIRYALRAMSSGGYAISADQEKANFVICLRWGDGIGNALPEQASPTKPRAIQI